jgi:hypothetical protein
MEGDMGTRYVIGWTVQGVLLVLFAACGIPRVAEAQATGANVGGVVTDESGARLPGVVITITNIANGRAQVLTTGEQGNYRAVALQPAPYALKAELAGFTTVQRDITLTVGADLNVDFKLSIATLQENVTVTGAGATVEVTKSELSSVVLPEQVNTLPSLGRNFLELAQLLPGTGPDNSRVQYFNPTKFAGVADQRNGFTTVIDGGDIDDAIWGSTTMNFTQDAVQEFRVFRHQFDAEYGAALAAVVTVVSKSGTNQINGSGFYFGRDDKLNARNAFTPVKPPFAQQRYGGSLGGPVVTNRTHFFGAYEFSNVDTARVIALPGVNPFASTENGVFPSGGDNHMVAGRFDHRLSDAHSLFVRYAYDNQKLLRTQAVTSDSNQIDEYSRSHSVVGEENWILSNRMVNTFRVHYLKQRVGNTPYSFDSGINRPSVQTGQRNISPQHFPKTKTTIFDTLYVNTPRHDLKIGGSFALSSTGFEAHFDENGTWTFATDAPFNPGDPRTFPFSLRIGLPGFREYESNQIGLFVQDNWRVADRVRLNLGLRYDLDTNLRNNAFYESLLEDPVYAGIENFVSPDRGNDYSAIQPRVGFTWDMRGTGTLVMRGGFGKYATRNRPWFQVFSINGLLGRSVLILDPERLRHFPDIPGVLGGQSVDAFAATTRGSLSPFIVGNDYVLPYGLNTTYGIGWQISPTTALDVDYVHDYGTKQLGGTDRNLPPSGPVGLGNPRPSSGFGIVSVMENFTRTWYDALETQLRTRFRSVDQMLVSYTLSRSYRDGVNFFGTFRGTQRTPDERGYNDTDQRHNVTFSAATTLPWQIQLSGIVKAVSGSPMLVQAGFDMDGDGSITNDRPAGLPTRVGREKNEESLRIINDLRATRGLPPIAESLLDLDPFVSVDLRVMKVFPLRADNRIELFLEAYNVTNHVNFQPFTVNPNIIAGDFLIRNSARDARQIQWGVRYAF